MVVETLLGQGFTAERVRKPAAFSRAGSVGARRAGMACAIIVALSLAAMVAPPRHAGASETDEKTARMLTLVNAARTESGLARLAAEARLASAACRHAQDLARGGPLSHRGSDGSHLGDRLAWSGYDFTLAAENLAAGIVTPDETVWLWLGSPGHRRNILTPDFRQAGIARVSGAGGEIWVLVLATPQAETAESLTLGDKARQPADLRGDKRLTCY